MRRFAGRTFRAQGALAKCFPFSVRFLSGQAGAGSRGEPSVPRGRLQNVFRSKFGLVGVSVRRGARRIFRAGEGGDGGVFRSQFGLVGASVRRFARRIFRALEGGDWAFSVFSLFFVGASVRRDAAPRIFYEILNRNLFRKMRKQDFIFLPKCYLMKLVKIFFSASG